MLDRLSTVFLLLSTLVIANTALAQNPFYAPFDARPRLIPSPQVKEQWERLSERENSCLEDALRRDNSSIKNMMQKNVAPTSPRLSNILSNCKAQEDAAALTDAKKQIAELTEQLSAARTEIRRLIAEANQLKVKASEHPQMQSKEIIRDRSSSPIPNNAGRDFIYTIGGVVFSVLGILFLIGLFAPKGRTSKNSSQVR